MYLPAWQGAQVEAALASTTLENVPASQGVQLVIVEEALLRIWAKVPAGQKAQASRAFLPGAQQEPAPAGLKLEGQPVQASGQ